MGKFEKEKPKKKKNLSRMLILVLCVVLVLILLTATIITIIVDWKKTPDLEIPGETNSATQPEEAVPEVEDIQAQTEAPVKLEENLQIRRIANYAGIYMEDGKDDTVSNVMMIILENTSEQDLQLARVSVVYDDFTAEFEVTNLPAGESVVALEKNRMSMPQKEYQSISVRNVIFFDEKMTCMDDQIEIIGGNGYLEVKNISGADIAGPVYIYYKNSAVDLLYGGITYRATIQDGLKADEAVRTLTGHYSEGNSRIVHVTCEG